MSTSIVIGLGSTGLQIVEHTQLFHYQLTGKNKTQDIEYLFMESDLSAEAHGTANGNDIKKVPLDLTQMAAAIPALKQQNISNEWIPAVNQAIATGQGAAGQSAYGRLSLWANWNEVYVAINQSWRNVQGNGQTNIFIVGSLTGGTCTGTFIDVAYLARQITGSRNIYGLFLIPGNSHVGISGGNLILENYLIATASLRNMTRTTGDIVYDYTWPNGQHVKQPASPFEQTYFLSTDYANNNANIGSIGELCKIAALNVCSRIIDGGKFQALYDGSIMNARQMRQGQYRFSTFDTIMIHYPQSQLTEWFGLKLCQEKLQLLVNAKDYVDKNNNLQSVLGDRNRINSQFNREFEELLDNALNSIDGKPTIGASNIDQAIEQDVDKLLKKDPTFKIYEAFTSSKNDNYFGFVSNNIVEIRNQLVDSIYLQVCKYLQDYKNLFVVKNLFDSTSNNNLTLQNHIQKILAFWGTQYGVDGNSSNFNKVISKYISNIKNNESLPTILFKKKEYYTEQLRNLYMLCKMHFGVSILSQIVAAIKTNQVANIVLRGNKYALPSLMQIDSIIVKIQSVNNIPRGQVGKDISSRILELDNEMTPSVHFKAIFNNSKKGDILAIENKYNALPVAQKFSMETMFGTDIFSYLSHVQNSRDVIYNVCVQKGVAYVTNLGLIGSQGIAGLLQNLSQRTPVDPQYTPIKNFFEASEAVIVPSAIPGLLGLRNNIQPAVQFKTDAFIKLLYTTSNVINIQNVMGNKPNYKGSYVEQLSPANQNCVDTPSFNNAIVIYQEYGNMSHRNYFDPIEDIMINSPIKGVVNTNITEAMHIVRCPYISHDDLKRVISLIP